MYLQFVLHICESAAAAFIMFTSLLYFLESMFKRHHIVFAFLWLISLSIIPSKSIYVAANTKFHSFLWLDITPLDGWMCVCVYMYAHTHIYTYMYICMYTHIYVYMYVHTYTYMYICMYTHIYTHIPHLYPFICWQTLRLLQYLDNCKQCCQEHWDACVFLN